MPPSTFGSINWKDAAKGFLIMFIGALITALYVAGQAIVAGGDLPSGHDVMIWLVASFTTGLGYLVKNFFTNSANQFAKKEGEDVKPPNQ